MKVEDLKSYMGDSERESVKRDIAVKKAVEFVMDHAKERAKAKPKTAEADAE
jgi:trigger factor